MKQGKGYKDKDNINAYKKWKRKIIKGKIK